MNEPNLKEIYQYLSPGVWRTVTEGGGEARRVVESLIKKLMVLEAKETPK